MTGRIKAETTYTSGPITVPAGEYFIGPSIDITRMTALQPGDILTAIRIPSTWAGAQFYFEKVRDRQVWDFPLMNVASAMVVNGGNIEKIRIVVNAAAATPLVCLTSSFVPLAATR